MNDVALYIFCEFICQHITSYDFQIEKGMSLSPHYGFYYIPGIPGMIDVYNEKGTDR